MHAKLLQSRPGKGRWSGSPCPPPRNLPNPGIEPASPALAGRYFTPEPQGNLQLMSRRQQQKRERRNKNKECEDFCGGPLAGSLRSQHRGSVFHLWSGIWVLHAAARSPMPQLKVLLAATKAFSCHVKIEDPACYI